MDAGLGRVGEQAGGLDHDVHPEVSPGKLGGILVTQELHRVAVHVDGIALDLDRRGKGAEGGVVLEQVAERLGVADIVHRDDLEVRLQVPGRAIDVAADASEAVDADLECHRGELLGVEKVEEWGRS